MLKKENIWLFMTSVIVYLIVSIIANGIYFSQVNVRGIEIVRYPQYKLYVMIGVMFLAFAGIITIYMTYYIYQALTLAGDEIKRQSLRNLFWGFIYYISVATIFVLIFGIAGILEIPTSIHYNLMGLKILPFVVFTGLGNFLLLIGLLYILLFSINEYAKKELSVKNSKIVIVLILIFIIAIAPTNYYALEPSGSSLYTRPLLLLTDLILALSLALYASAITFRTARHATNPKTKKRLILVGLGFLMFLFVFTIPLIGIILLKGIPLFFWYTIGFMINFISITLIYLGLLTPNWLMKWL